MKKLFCLAVALVMLTGAVLLTACNGDPLAKISKDCDGYTIVSSYDPETHILSATQKVEMKNRADNGFDAVKFHIYANQYRQDAKNGVVPSAYKSKAYRWGESFGDISFDSVKVNDSPVAYTIEGEDLDILSVPMPTALMPDQKATVEMTYQIQLANIAHRLGYSENSVNLGNFYPILCSVENNNYNCAPYYNVGDPFVSEVANYNVTFTLPENFVVASSGDLKEASNENGNATYKYEAKAVRDFAMVLSDKYKKLSQTVGSTQVNYYYYNDLESEASLDAAAKMLEFLNKNVGEYPYSQYSVCETEFCYGGMEYPNLVMVTSGSQSYKEAVIHETAHQWFYGIVGNDQINNAWMDEGLAEFLTYLFMNEDGIMPLHDSVKANLKTYITYVDVLNHYYDNVDTSFRPLSGYRNDGEYVVFTYVKGSLLFNTAYETMGKNKFMKALSNYFDGARFTVAAPSQLIDSFSKVGGAEIGTIFNNFIEGKEIIGKVTDK